MSERVPSGVERADIPARCIEFAGRYCNISWRNARLHGDAWPDATQSVLVVLLQERFTTPEQWVRMTDDPGGDERKELVRAIDRVKKRHQRARKPDGSLGVVADDTDRVEREHANAWEHVVHLMRCFSSFQQNILRLTREGWGVQEIALQLGRPVERVSDEKHKAIKKLRALLAPA